MWRKVAPIAALTLMLGCSDKDIGQIRRTSAKAFGKVRPMVSTATGQLRTGMSEVDKAVPAAVPVPSAPGVAGTIEARLKADRGLRGASISVAKTGKGVSLNGTVTDAYQKRRAGELSRSMRGAGVVQNNLKVTSQK